MPVTVCSRCCAPWAPTCRSVRTPWEQVLRTQAARALAPKRALSWSRPARSYIARQGRSSPTRRLPWEPGESGSQPVPRLVLVVDVSGSIADDLLDRFARELEALTRRLGAGLVLVVGDERVQSVSRFEPGRSSDCATSGSPAAAAPISPRCWKRPAATGPTWWWC